MVSLRSALLVASILGALGTTLKVSYKDCGNADTNGKMTSLSPSVITTGVDTAMTAGCNVKHAVFDGSFEAKLNAGGGLVKETYTGGICTGATFTLPLNLGSLSWDGMQCPVEAGHATVGMHIKLSKFIPGSLATSSIKVTMSDNLLCAVIHIAPAMTSVGETVEAKFQQFEAFYGKNFAADERAARLAAFAQNLDLIEQLQEADEGDAVFSHLSPFADISSEEFTSRFGLWQDEANSKKVTSAPDLDSSSLPAEFDWRGKGAVNAIQNQGRCGSCWAFSAVQNLEGAIFVSSGSLPKLSEQQLTACSEKNHGCNGGNAALAYQEMIDNNYGLETESSYPYTAGGGDSGSCIHPGPEVAFIGDWMQFSLFEDKIAAGLVQYGPLSIILNATPLQTYSSGILDLSIFACMPKPNHAVGLVGYGTASSKKYWTVRNSWSTEWGEQGYVRLAYGKAVCGMNLLAVTVLDTSLKGVSVAV